MELTKSFETLLLTFSPVFTAPSFQTFRLLMTGWILSVRHRYVTDLIISSDSVSNGHFSDYHRFFSHASWDIDHLWRLLARSSTRSSVKRRSSPLPGTTHFVASEVWGFLERECITIR